MGSAPSEAFVANGRYLWVIATWTVHASRYGAVASAIRGVATFFALSGGTLLVVIAAFKVLKH